MDTPEPDYSQPVLVEYPMPETDAERKKRIALGLPTPTYSFMVTRHKESSDVPLQKN